MQSIEQLPTADHFITHAQKMRDLLNLFPRGVDRLLLVIDPANPPEAVLAMIPWLAERWDPQITLLHGGKLRSSGRAAGESDRDDLVDLLCFGWELKNHYSDLSIGRHIMHSWRQVQAEATEYEADVIPIPEELAAGFQPPGFAGFETGDRSLPFLEIFSGGQTGIGRSSIQKLSDREFEVFEALGEGLSSHEIAKKLHLSAKTVDAHRANIKTKLKINTTAELISFSARWAATQSKQQI